MGAGMAADDIYIAGLLDILNIRFGLRQDYEKTEERRRPGEDDYDGGIAEMVVLQEKFGVFRKEYPLSLSLRVMNLGGFWNARARNRWYRVFDYLEKCESDLKGVTAHARLRDVFIDNLKDARAKPMYFVAHDARPPGSPALLIGEAAHGAFYMEAPHIHVSIPLTPRKPETETRSP